MLRRAFITLPLAVFSLAPFIALAGDGDARTGLFRASAYADHVRYLASNELGGRKPGTEGIEKASQYIARKFREAGCEGAGDNGSFFQEFSVNDGKGIDDAKALLQIDGLGKLELRKDWTPMPFSKDGEVDGPLAFVGYGVEAPDDGYNDYDGFDAEGKVLLMFRYEPRNKDPKAALGGKESSDHSLFKTKSKRAAEHKAKAMLVVNPPGRPSDEDALYPFSRAEMWQTMDVPVISITRAAAEKLLKQAGMPDLASLQTKIDTDWKPASKDMTLKVTLNAAIGPKKAVTKNVIGLLKGDGSTDEIIVVGAHYDHLGTTQRQFVSSDPTAQIHNGADDNASGSSGVLELARAIGAGPKNRRNIVFMTYSAEEMGLLGSKHFVDNPTFDLQRVKAMVNLDMIGRFRQHKFEIYGVDTGTGFEELVKDAAAKAGIEYTATPRTAGVFGQSDHASFYRKNIPVLFPFTGLHKQYHQPEDDWELIDAEGATQVLDMMYGVIRQLANMESGPEFIKPESKKKKESEVAASEKAGEKKPEKAAEVKEPGAKDSAAKSDANSDAPVRTRPSARLGIMPSYTSPDESKPGMLVDGVTDDGPAKKAGIEQGDRILKIGPHEVKDIESYMDAVSKFKPGDTTDILVDRNGLKVTIKVTFGGGAARRENK